MNIETKSLGLLSIHKSQIFFFDQGIPGFSKLNYFALIKDKKKTAFSYLQSIESKNICFVLVQAQKISAFYRMSLEKNDISHLRLKSYNMEVYHIINIKKNSKHLVNLKAPLIFNVSSQQARQCIVQEDYPIQYPLSNLNKKFFLKQRK